MNATAFADRETELRDLLAMASHDLRSPLTSVTAHVEMLRADYVTVLGDDFARDIAAIERGLRRMTRLTQDLFEYARAGHELDLAPTSLAEMVADVISDHVTGTDQGSVTVTGALPRVYADAALLRHVLDNLIGNAVKYTRPGVPAQVEIGAHGMPDGAVLIAVTDRGIGIPAADRAGVFEPYRRGANSGGYTGTGLGLAICRRIVERHGGHIGVDENPAGGSRFWFTLPAVRD
ncbi:HAMP domain-containing sensor histidine kinase [Actinoplanes sp. NPDC051851]|uniref:sensor histidine kinase n=1 Tax=Actinoplanes sp. NPDC051851 TaxID=3154753 RepID=UPI003413C7F0